jgi:MFS family permease
MSDAAASANTSLDVSPAKLRQVIIASSAGTIFEWYDFFVYGALTSIMAANFYSNLPEAQALIFSLLTFSVGLVVRPFGALVFGKIGDSAGRKGAFLITISVMGLATVAIGLLPTQAQLPPDLALAAPVLLVGMRVLQGFALGGEYGGAAVYVAEHAPRKHRGSATAGIQCSAAIGLVGALAVILATRGMLGEDAFKEWGWRIPFLLSAALLALSLWIRLRLEESPAFKKIKAEGNVSKRAYAESFFEWRNLKFVLLALFGLMMAQGVVWYTGHFYAQVFIERILKVDQKTVNWLMITIVAISAPLYVFFAWLSDRVGRKPIMLFGMVLMALAYFPGFHMLTRAANPALAAATEAAPATVVADPSDCSFQLDLTGGAARFLTSCDIAKSALTSAGVNYETVAGPPGALAQVRVGAASVESVNAAALPASEQKAARDAFAARLREALNGAGYPEHADAAAINFPLALGVLFIFIVAATALYGPQAAALVELFPTRIRYTALSLPYNIGTGWFGALLAPLAVAISTTTGNIYAGLWFPLIVTALAALIFLTFWPETKDRDIHAADASPP